MRFKALQATTGSVITFDATDSLGEYRSRMVVQAVDGDTLTGICGQVTTRSQIVQVIR